MPTCYMLIGAPCTRKSTFYNDHFQHLPSVSSDAFIEQYAQERGVSYQEVFSEFVSSATRLMNVQLDALIAQQQDFVWDQTNMNQRARAKKLARLKGYEVIAIVFVLPIELHKSLYSARTSKIVPWDVIETMLKHYEEPTITEGFSSIVFAPVPDIKINQKLA
jgi:predicted kinase